MKPNVLLAVVAAAFAVSTGACIWLVQTYASGMTPIMIFMDSGVIAKLCMLIIQLTLFLALIGGLIPVRMLAHLSAGAAVTFGLLGALYGEMMTQAALRAVGPVSFAVTAPGRADSLFCLSMGLFVALVALGLLRLRGG